MADKEVLFDDAGGETSKDSCGSNIPVFASLAALGLIVAGAFIALLVILDRLQLDAANRATTSAVRGALDFTATAIGAVFEETRVLALRLARDRQSGRYPSCINDTANGDDVIFPLASTMNASITQVFGVYDVVLAPGVAQTTAALTYTLCGVLSNTKEANLFRSGPPRVVSYRLGDLPKEVLGAQVGQWAGEAWNQTDEPYVQHVMTLGDGQLTPSATQTGDWSMPSIWIDPSSGVATLYASVHVPVAYNGPTGAPSEVVSVDLFGSGFRPLLQQVGLEDTHAAIIDPRMDPVVSLRRSDAPNGLLLASTFDNVPTFRNTSGRLAMWPADGTPSPLLNGAVRTVVSHLPAGLLSLTTAADYSNGPSDTVVGAIPVVRPGRLRLVVLLVTPHSVFDGNLKRGRKISGGVGAACGVVCVVALCAFIVISNHAAQGLLKHVLTNSGRDVACAPKDQSKPFTIVFTDIQSSTALWARLPQQMGAALDVHHATIRECIAVHKGYEVKTIGDSFMVAFKDPLSAVEFALAIQISLRDAQWKVEAIDQQYYELIGTSYPDHQQMSPNDQEYSGVWSGLRVRAGVHYGTGSIIHDEVTKGYDYYGTVVNTAARIEGVAHGGQVLITDETYDAIAAGPSSPDSKYSPRDGSRNASAGAEAVLSGCDVVPLGPQPLRGLDETKTLIQILPESLKNRSFPPLRLDVEKTIGEQDNDVTSECVAATSTGSYNFKNGTPLTNNQSSVQGGDVSSTMPPSEQNIAVAEVIWRKHKVTMNLLRFTLCCEAVRATLAPLPNVQRKASLKTLAKKWRVPHTDSAGAALPDSVLIATILARAAQSIVVGNGPDEKSMNPTRHISIMGTSPNESKTSVSAMHLPSGGGKLAGSMMMQCTSVTTAPTLPVPDLAEASERSAGPDSA